MRRAHQTCKAFHGYSWGLKYVKDLHEKTRKHLHCLASLPIKKTKVAFHQHFNILQPAAGSFLRLGCIMTFSCVRIRRAFLSPPSNWCLHFEIHEEHLCIVSILLSLIAHARTSYTLGNVSSAGA